jgi:16S rRNA (cytosine967-C5)-methyltransferase
VPEGDPRGAKSGRLGRLHDRLVDAVMLVKEGTPSDRALDQVFRRARDLGSSERSKISDDVYALARGQRRFADLLDRAAKAEGRKLELLDAPLRARLEILTMMADRGVGADDLQAADSYAFRRFPGLFERITSGRVPEPKKRSAVERIAISHSLPDGVATRLVAAFGEERADAMASALLERAPLTLRVNALKASRDEARKRIEAEHEISVEPSGLSPFGLILSGRVSVQGWPMFEEGWIEVQDEGSQLIALALGAKPGEIVIDACAGAGGKTLALGAMMENTGRLIALDRDEQKLLELKRRARRAGLTNHETVTADFIALPEELKARADRVLIDAPCTGSGAYRRNPDSRWRFSETDLAKDMSRQRSLLLRAVDAVKPGGLILYATCSLLIEEDEAIVRGALASDPRLEPVPLAVTLGEGLAKRLGATHEVRVGPGPGPKDPDGFYFALLRARQ